MSNAQSTIEQSTIELAPDVVDDDSAPDVVVDADADVLIRRYLDRPADLVPSRRVTIEREGHEISRVLVPGPTVPFVVSRDANEGLEPAPLPADWLHGGSPTPRMRFTAMGADGATASGIWACNAGVFTFVYDFDEWVHIISGSVTIEAGPFCKQLRAGSTAFFPRGLSTTWHVEDHVHKFFVQRNPPKATRVFRKLTGKKSPFD